MEIDMHIPETHPLTRRTILKGSALALPALAATAGWSPAWAQGATPVGTTAPPVASIPDLVAGNTAFALDLYTALRQAEGNLLVSPYSISLALAMAGAGARGDTLTQMAETLHFDLDQPALHGAFGALTPNPGARGTAAPDAEPVMRDLELVQQARGLRIASALWGEQSYPSSPAYTAQLEEAYGAGLEESDFINAPEAARQEINAWVADQTEDHIQDIVPEGAITAATRLVLANALWFSAGWESTFARAATEDGDFHLLDGDSVIVHMMLHQEPLHFAEGDGYQAVQLGYLGSSFAFTVLLPDVGQFAQVEAGLDADALQAAIDHLTSTEVLLYLPKFEFAFDASLAPTLQALGMVDAFEADRADFSGMVEGPPAEPLVIDDVLHQAVIAIDEEGTEAAAATVVDSFPGAAPPEPEPPVVRVDRPFLFAIRDTQTGTLLFLGRVLDPNS
jgi:serpin B